ncbi:MAG: dihydropteroate synthase [Acidimicrobiia bacterium]|nr:dihydropteroate synthase [Acidimicrobiia bacterium]
MGIVNVTPDSFSDGGAFLDTQAAIGHGRRLLAEGADWLDVGGESTRPGASPVGLDQELERVVPVIEALAADGWVSVDTTKPAVARAAVAAGARMVNDVSSSLAPVCAELGVAWVAMHRQGQPATMQDAPAYDDVVTEVAEALQTSVDQARVLGVADIWIDPGIGFGKTTDHNLDLLARLDVLVGLGAPVLVGASRKRFLGRLHALADGRDDDVGPDDRLEGSLAVATWAAHAGAAMVRVHDVAPTVQAMHVVAA